MTGAGPGIAPSSPPLYRPLPVPAEGYSEEEHRHGHCSVVVGEEVGNDCRCCRAVTRFTNTDHCPHQQKHNVVLHTQATI